MRYPLPTVTVLCLSLLAVGSPSRAQFAPGQRPAPSKAYQKYNATIARGRKELTRYNEAQRRKMFGEFIYAGRQAANLMVSLMGDGPVMRNKAERAGKKARATYYNPLYRKYRITEAGRLALDSEGGNKNWPLPNRYP